MLSLIYGRNLATGLLTMNRDVRSRITAIDMSTPSGRAQLRQLLGMDVGADGTRPPKARSKEAIERKGYTKLMLAVRDKQPAHTLADITKAGVDVDATDYKRRTAICMAAQAHELEHLFALIRDCRASPSGGYFWEDGFNVFHYLAARGSYGAIRELGRLLLKRGDSKQDIRKWVNETCRIPGTKEDLSPVRLLILRLAPEMVNGGLPPVNPDAVVQCIKALVDMGAQCMNKPVVGFNGMDVTPFHYMCQIGNLMAVIGMWTHLAIDVNAATPEDNVTPLYVACTKGHVGVAAFLLSVGADPRIDVRSKFQNGEPCNAADFAKVCKYEGIRKLFPAS